MAVIGTLVVLGLAIPLIIKGDKSEAVKELNPLESLSDTSQGPEIIEAIRYAAKNTGADPEMMVAYSSHCENIGLKDICIIDTNGLPSCGYFMFQEKTFKGYCPDLKWGKGFVKDNIICAARMFAMGEKVIKRHWVNCTEKWLKGEI